MRNNENETVIQLNILTGYKNEATGILGDVRAARQRIEKTAFYVDSLFSLIKISKVAVIEQDFDGAQMVDYLDDIELVCELGSSLSGSLLSSIAPVERIESDIEESERGDERPSRAEPKELFNVGNLADELSAILRTPELPEEIFNSLMHFLNDLYNKSDAKALNDFETSPEYIGSIFSAYLDRERRQND